MTTESALVDDGGTAATPLQNYTENEAKALWSMYKYYKDDEDSDDGDGSSASVACLSVINDLGRHQLERSSMSRALEDVHLASRAAAPGALLRVLNRAIADDATSHRHHFLRLLHGYRQRSEVEGRYLLAQQFAEHERRLRLEEEGRQVEAAKRKYDNDRNRIAKAHATQMKEFATTWEAFLENYDRQSRDCIEELDEAHQQQMSTLQQSVADKMDAQPIKWSRDLLQHRHRQALMADQRRYREAQRTKLAGDALEEEERANRNAGLHDSLRRRERALRARQRAERDVLAKRVGSERRKFERRKDEDCKRLAQRNRIILADIEAKHASECSTLASKVKESMKGLLKEGGSF